MGRFDDKVTLVSPRQRQHPGSLLLHPGGGPRDATRGHWGRHRHHWISRRPRQRADAGPLRRVQGRTDRHDPQCRYALSRDHIDLLDVGWMDTPGEDAIQRRYHGARDDWLAAAEARMPFEGLLETDEVAAAVAFLASDDPSGMMTGPVVDFDQSVIGAGSQPTLGAAEVP